MEWPFGTYTLVKPKSGCPPDWLEGWRYQDTEDFTANNRITPSHHFAGIKASLKIMKKIIFEKYFVSDRFSKKVLG